MKRSIEHIIQEYNASLFKICLGYSHSFQDAEDLLQDVFINIWKGLESFREDANIKTWLYRVTVNTCLLTLRKKSIKTISVDNINQSWISVIPHSNSEKESFELLHQLIQKLPHKEKSIILLYLEGLTHQDIANVVGISSNYVGVKINRIKQKLSNKIK